MIPQDWVDPVFYLCISLNGPDRFGFNKAIFEIAAVYGIPDIYRVYDITSPRSFWECHGWNIRAIEELLPALLPGTNQLGFWAFQCLNAWWTLPVFLRVLYFMTDARSAEYDRSNLTNRLFRLFSIDCSFPNFQGVSQLINKRKIGIWKGEQIPIINK